MHNIKMFPMLSFWSGIAVPACILPANISRPFQLIFINNMHEGRKYFIDNMSSLTIAINSYWYSLLSYLDWGESLQTYKNVSVLWVFALGETLWTLWHVAYTRFLIIWAFLQILQMLYMTIILDNSVFKPSTCDWITLDRR